MKNALRGAFCGGGLTAALLAIDGYPRIEINVAEDGLPHLNKQHCSVNFSLYALKACQAFRELSTEHGFINGFQYGIVLLPSLGLLTKFHLVIPSDQYIALDACFSNQFRRGGELQSESWLSYHFNESEPGGIQLSEKKYYSHYNLWFFSAQRDVSVIGEKDRQGVHFSREYLCSGESNIQLLCLYNEYNEDLQEEEESVSCEKNAGPVFSERALYGARCIIQ